MPDLGILRGLITLITLGTFGGICWWAYRASNRERFENDGWLVFDDEESVVTIPIREPKTAAREARNE